MSYDLPNQLFLAVVMFGFTISLQMAATLGALEVRRHARASGKALTRVGASLQVGLIATSLLILAFLQSLIWAFSSVRLTFE